MSKLTRNLYDIDCILNETRGVGCIITEEDMRYIEAIRLELTNLAGPEDIDAVKFIKAELNKNYGVVNIRNVDMPNDDWISDMRSAIVKEIREEMDAKILNYLDEHNNLYKKKDDSDLIEIPDPTDKSITGSYVTKNPLNEDNDWLNKHEDPEKYKK